MEIKDYLKYYIGQQCQITNEGEKANKFILNAYNYNYYKDWHSDIKPILRRLSSITEEEMKELDKTKAFQRATPVHQIGLRVWTAESFAWAINKGFWIFGDEAFETGLIIEKK